MLLWFSPNCFQRRHIHTLVGRPWITSPSTCADVVLFKQFSHSVPCCWSSWQWTRNPATILSLLHPLGILWLRHDFHCQRLTDTSLFSLPTVTEAIVLSGLSAVCLHTSAGEPRAAAWLLLGSSHVRGAWIWSVTWICLRKRRSAVYFMLLCYITLKFSLNFLPFGPPLKGIVTQMCVSAPTFPEFVPSCLCGLLVKSWDRPPGRVNKAARSTLKLPSYY